MFRRSYFLRERRLFGAAHVPQPEPGLLGEVIQVIAHTMRVLVAHNNVAVALALLLGVALKHSKLLLREASLGPLLAYHVQLSER